MTAYELQREFEGKRNLLFEMREAELVSEEVYQATLERVKNETFFAVSVQDELDNLPIAAGH